ncbi:MAG: NADH-quinone oxidoreductase subunit A [Planctomycetota bacterium]|nr:MAG: NADH-quinone oxidoreductase subunit A [Planctomycetota bacterium]
MADLNLHLLLAIVAGIGFILAPLTLGWLVRPNTPTEEKLAPYECGEPAIGSAYVQFDLRFYVVALLFIIFDVEVAFFFPWGTIFGGATQLADPQLSEATRMAISDRLLDLPAGTSTPGTAITPEAALTLSWIGLGDIAVFFAVLLVGFAYVWKRGDLDWVRAMVAQSKENAVKKRERPIVAPLEA